MESMKYADAGVNLSAWHDTRKRIGQLVQSTYSKNVVGDFGQFGGLFDISFVKKYECPVLVSSVDGVGTKLKIAFETGIHNTVGVDIVNHCIDDILVMGATPLYFLDYIGTGKLSPLVAQKVIEGLTDACREAGVSLIGGETAEMPGFYSAGEYDIAGTIVGVVDKNKIVDGSSIVPGDTIIGLRSNGLHTNGYSLARKIVEEAAGNKYTDLFEPTGIPIGEELLRPHRSYLNILPLFNENKIKGCAHITGGGFQENIDRILPANCNASIDTTSWKPHAIFKYLQKHGNVELDEMYRTFNMGVGLTIVVNSEHAQSLLEDPVIKNFDGTVIGNITEGTGVVELEY